MNRFVYIFYFLIHFHSTFCTTGYLDSINYKNEARAVAHLGNQIIIAYPSNFSIYNVSVTDDKTSFTLYHVAVCSNMCNNGIYDHFEFVSSDSISYCSDQKVCAICNISEQQADCRELTFKEYAIVSLSITWNGTLSGLFFVKIDYQNGNKSVIKSYNVPSENSSLPIPIYNGIVHENSSTNNYVMTSFTTNGYAYFLSNLQRVELVTLTKLHGSKSQRVLNIIRLSRICANDGSGDIISKMDVPLTCGSSSVAKNSSATGAYFNYDSQMLYVSILNQDTSSHELCYYAIKDIEARFSEDWSACQNNSLTGVKKITKCGGEVHSNITTGERFCSIISSHMKELCEKIYTKDETKLENCAASYPKMSRFGHLESMYPYSGHFLANILTNDNAKRRFAVSNESGVVIFAYDDGVITVNKISKNNSITLISKDSANSKPWTGVSSDNKYIYYSSLRNLAIYSLACKNLYNTCDSLLESQYDGGKCLWCYNKPGFRDFAFHEDQSDKCTSDGGRIADKIGCPPTINDVKRDSINPKQIVIDGKGFDLSKSNNYVITICGKKCDVILENSTPEKLYCNFFNERVTNTCVLQIKSDKANFVVSFPVRYDVATSTTSSGLPRSMKAVITIAAILLLVLLIICAILLRKYCVKILNSVSERNKLLSDDSSNEMNIPSKKSDFDTYNNSYITPNNSSHRTNKQYIDRLDRISERYRIYPGEIIISRTELIGSGNYGEVRMGELTKRAGIDLRDNIPVACKFLKDKFHSQLHEKNNETMEEYKNLMNQSHENIVDFYGITYHVNFGYAIVTGYLPLKDIEKFVAEENKNTIRKADTVNWLKDIARGMTYIHEKNMIHRDLAARNVLLEEIPDREKIEHDSLNTRAKITDFGLARPLNSEMEYQIYSGPPLPIRSVAPECLTSTHFSKENDIWAFGCIIWELLHRNEKKYPECKNINELQQFLITEGKRLKFKEEDTSANYKKLVEVATNCFCKEPRIRGSFDQILSNLEQIDYEEDEILYQPSHHTHLKY